MFNLDMQKKIVAAAMFKGLGDRRFPMYPLLNAANAIAQQEATGQLFTMSEDGSAVPLIEQNCDTTSVPESEGQRTSVNI